MRFLILCSLLLCAVTLYPLTEETASLTDFMYGTTDATAYDNYYHRIVEGLASPGYNQYAPWDSQTNGFGNFVNASSTQRANWGEVMDFFLAEMFTEAQSAIDQHGFPYEVVEFHDTDTGRTLYMLREHLNLDYFDDNDAPDQPDIHQHGSFDYGWGLYVFNPASDIPVIVNVVHPKDDFITIPVATKAFQLWDARYMMISGAGREALWTNVPPYWNSKSLSDPSRNANHVFNVAYNRICDEIRDTFARREHSVQIHSFDYTHMGYNHLQISGGGWNYNYPGLPIRDISGNNLDLVNASEYVVIPANTIGIHDDILVTDYYSVLYNQHGLYYTLGDELLPISNNINLPGADGNRQVVYTQSNWNKYDVFTPFFHIELEELPSVYPQNMNYYKWFYGFDAITQTWNVDELWSRSLEFYIPWLEHYAEILPDMLEFDDGVPPSDPSDLVAVSTSYNNIVLDWERSYSYDFETYEILFSTEPINLVDPNYSIRNRNNISTLAGQAYTRATVTGLQADTQYFFMIRAKDYNGNYSNVSNEVSRYTGSATIANLSAHGRDGYVDVRWLAQYQNNNQGFNVWRSLSGEEDYELIASWETEEELVGSDDNNIYYNYADDQVENGLIYDYKIASVDDENNEYLHIFVASASPQRIYTLTIQNDSGIISDTVEFGANPFASDGYDSNYDILKDDPPGGAYIYAMSYKSNWSTALRNLQRDIYGYFDPDMEYKTWTIRVSTNQTSQPISISISDNFGRNSEKLYLRCTTTGNMIDLTEESLIFEAESTSYRYFTLYWGNLLPTVNINNISNRFLQAGDDIIFNWSASFNLLIDSIDIYLSNGTDSLNIASQLPYDTTSYSWTVPDNILLTGANLVIRTIVIDGYPLDHISNYKLGIIPTTVNFMNQAGWHLKSNPFESPNFSGTILFGPDSQLFRYNHDEGTYQEVISYPFGVGHWLYMPVDYELSTTGNIRNLQYEIPLLEGWNLIPNVFMEDIYAKDFLFVLDGSLFTFIEAVQYDMIDRAVYGVENNRYRLSDNLRKQESIWLYCLIPDLVLRFIPFQDNPDFADFPYNWQTTIVAEQSDFRADEVIVGSAKFTNEYYNPLFDLPKPPHRPETAFYFYLPVDENTHPVDRLHSDFKGELNDNNNESRFWDFELLIDSELSPIHFRRTESDLPDLYSVILNIGDESLTLYEGEEVIYIPESDIISGQIEVRNYGGTAVEDVPEAAVLLGNYPNPFFTGNTSRQSTGTNIAFSLDRRDRVKLEVFNIKGQKVITLLDEPRDTGKHTVYWNGYDSRNRAVAAGVYLCRLIVGDRKTEVRKMMLLK